MKRLKTRKSFIFFFVVVLVLSSCKTIPDENGETPVETFDPIDAAERDVALMLETVEDALTDEEAPRRDIDNREWLMEEISRRADADQLMISLIYDALFYRGWDDESKRNFLTHLVGNRINEDPKGVLNAMRAESLEELSYLLNQSRILKDSPWMVRDFFDEKSEFSYWYLLYIGRSFDSEWQKDTVLPVMRTLIREDRITAASYVWLSKPESLGDMDREIRSAGYPWNRIIHLKKMGRYIRSELNRLFPSDSSDPRPEGMLF